MYDLDSLKQLGKLLEETSRKLDRNLYLVSDEPYGEIVFDGRELPDLFSCYVNTILVNSYSKSLSIPGERLGTIAVHPHIEEVESLLDGLNFCNRILNQQDDGISWSRQKEESFGNNCRGCQLPAERFEFF